ncbi:hypothetical protein ABL78_6044 [Leptomonas seymouri]|uniref:Uncharacterized protein n=1 Tax=Leptomonas seymouri TaxID=5684 RepID=A0A0N0P460_LEPSE|nr:hypothetical protein ABL78_6044 [Leptomonas seymouri]|eukprot:KPI84919.1 hypothetical protein ABL78_6044 [Leptomonas seymouri]
MLRSTSISRYWRATAELDRLRGLLRGRARLEKKVGLKRITFLMRTQTRYRVEQKSHWERAIVRKNVDSAAHEHGSGWQHLRNDLARQNMMLLPRMQQQLSLYEPLAFRAVMELCASRVPPPPPPMTAQVPEEAYAKRAEDGKTAHPAARRELKEGVERMLRVGGSEKLQREGPKTIQAWMDAWKEYDVGASARN